jgi:hypothetical protein
MRASAALSEGRRQKLQFAPEERMIDIAFLLKQNLG